VTILPGGAKRSLLLLTFASAVLLPTVTSLAWPSRLIADGGPTCTSFVSGPSNSNFTEPSDLTLTDPSEVSMPTTTLTSPCHPWIRRDRCGETDGTLENSGTGARIGYPAPSYYYGNSGSVAVNDFSEHQVRTWRSLGMFRDSTTFVEGGWLLAESLDQLKHPYRTYKNEGLGPYLKVLPTENLSIGFHAFNVKDADGNKTWSIHWDTHQIGIGVYVNIDGLNGFPLQEAESGCTSDSRFSRFRFLKSIYQLHGTWAPYGSLTPFVVGSPYNLCLLQPDGFDTKKGAC
jgi:hypothetical protein